MRVLQGRVPVGMSYIREGESFEWRDDGPYEKPWHSSYKPLEGVKKNRAHQKYLIMTETERLANLCPRCEQNQRGAKDYLCVQCRFGVEL
jgi:hypothetical protein